MNDFAHRLRKLMDLKKINQQAVADGASVHRSRVSAWVNKKTDAPRRDTLQKLSEFFGCNIDWLAEGKGEPFPQSQEKTVVSTGEFERRQTDKVMNEKLAKIEKAVFKTQCPGYLDDFFNFIADKYAANKEGVEAFLEETSKTNPKFKDWLREKKKRGEGSLSDEQQYVQNGE